MYDIKHRCKDHWHDEKLLLQGRSLRRFNSPPSQIMAEYFRDTAFGHFVRLVTRNNVFQYPEEQDPEIWRKYIHQEKSEHVAHHGNTLPPEDNDDGEEKLDDANDNVSDVSSQTHVRDTRNHASAAAVDLENGKDVHVVDWYGPDDRQVCSFFPFFAA